MKKRVQKKKDERRANREVTRFNVSVNLWHAVKMTGNITVAVSTTLYILYFIIGKSINYSKYVVLCVYICLGVDEKVKRKKFERKQ